MREPTSNPWALFIGCTLVVGCGGKTQGSAHDLEQAAPDAAARSSSTTGNTPTKGPTTGTGGASAVDASTARTSAGGATTGTAGECALTEPSALPADSCNLLGAWNLNSAPWNGLSTKALIIFCAGGTLLGVPSFNGKWSLVDSNLSIWGTTGQDMTCAADDHWTLTFSADCATAPLIPISSGCTGARRYLDWDVTLTRQ
jgi:hypothetical protein